MERTVGRPEPGRPGQGWAVQIKHDTCRICELFYVVDQERRCGPVVSQQVGTVCMCVLARAHACNLCFFCYYFFSLWYPCIFVTLFI